MRLTMLQGIAPTLVILRVSLGHARTEAEWSTPTLRSMVFSPTHIGSPNIGELCDGSASNSQGFQVGMATENVQDGTSSWSKTKDIVC